MSIQWGFSVGGTELTVHGIYQDGKPKRATKLITDGRHVSYVNGDGKFYSTRACHSSRHYGHRWQGHTALIREAIALGALPKSNALKLAKIEERRRERSHAAYAARDAISSAASAGVTLPAATLRMLKRKARAA